ncbi:4367_t:CDS:2 [Funneliformis mosseae]|uniref:4367_t:CDS:1 n=1 Tax=Funneliformis mosseae TaxID=27381 RepID=A0A9N8WI92_FUNMO|nr:4367_t:CDS:2 [Funneliformis mosseae]
MDTRKQQYKVTNTKVELQNEFEQDSIIDHVETDTMLMHTSSQETMTMGLNSQKDQWTEMEQSIQAINPVRVQGIDVDDGDMISVSTMGIDYGDDSEIEEKMFKKVPHLAEEVISKLEEELYRHDMAIKQLAQNLNIDVLWVQKYMNDHHETVTSNNRKRRKSGYNVFQATEWWPNHKEEFNSSFGAESNRACAIAWKSLLESDKQKYEEMAALDNEKMKEVQLKYIENSRKRHTQVQSDINNIKTTIRCMEKKCGVEVAMFVAPNRSDDSFSSRFIGSSGGEAFFSASPEMCPLLDKFEIYTKNRYLEQTGQIVIPPAKRVKREPSITNSTSKSQRSSNESPHSPIAVSSTHRNINSADVKARVRAILRARYNSALGTEGLIIPYKKWKDHQGEIEVIGWPEDVPFDDFG